MACDRMPSSGNERLTNVSHIVSEIVIQIDEESAQAYRFPSARCFAQSILKECLARRAKKHGFPLGLHRGQRPATTFALEPITGGTVHLSYASQKNMTKNGQYYLKDRVRLTEELSWQRLYPENVAELNTSSPSQVGWLNQMIPDSEAECMIVGDVKHSNIRGVMQWLPGTETSFNLIFGFHKVVDDGGDVGCLVYDNTNPALTVRYAMKGEILPPYFSYSSLESVRTPLVSMGTGGLDRNVYSVSYDPFQRAAPFRSCERSMNSRISADLEHLLGCPLGLSNLRRYPDTCPCNMLVLSVLKAYLTPKEVVFKVPNIGFGGEDVTIPVEECHNTKHEGNAGDNLNVWQVYDPPAEGYRSSDKTVDKSMLKKQMNVELNAKPLSGYWTGWRLLRHAIEGLMRLRNAAEIIKTCSRCGVWKEVLGSPRIPIPLNIVIHYHQPLPDYIYDYLVPKEFPRVISTASSTRAHLATILESIIGIQTFDTPLFLKHGVIYLEKMTVGTHRQLRTKLLKNSDVATKELDSSHILAPYIGEARHRMLKLFQNEDPCPLIILVDRPEDLFGTGAEVEPQEPREIKSAMMNLCDCVRSLDQNSAVVFISPMAIRPQLKFNL